jgi:predicted PurR-regulated permease PerM
VPPQRVEVVVGARTLLALVAFGVLVALAILSLGALLSIFVAAVIALGLDAVVGALVRRGWRRGRAALAVFAALFVAVFALVIVTAIKIVLGEAAAPRRARMAALREADERERVAA